MNKKRNAFIKSLKILFGRLFRRRVHFSKEYKGTILTNEDKQQFEVIRDLRIDSLDDNEHSWAVFKVRFKFSGLPLAVNKRTSLFPAPFLIAKPGFREKIWAVSEDGYFQGIYQWATKESAETYPNSFIFKMMIKRAAKGSVVYEIIPDTVLSEYMNRYIQ